MSFGTLALIGAVALLGPVLTMLPTRAAPPIVIGEIAAGVAFGVSGTRTIAADDPTLLFLADIGFALLMFVVGTNLPMREYRLGPAVRRGVLATGVTVVAAAALAPLVAWAGHLHRPAVAAVLLAATSAAVALPIIEEPRGRRLLVLVAWVAIADVVTVLAVPLVFSRDDLGRAIAGSALILGAAAAIGLLGGRLRGTAPVEALRAASARHGFAIDLRVSLLVLFGLAWVAERFDTSVLIAGFAAGAMVAALGPPRRVAEQLIGLGEGFFVPLFFVVLGARLDLRALFRSHEDLGLLVLLTVGAVVVHVIAAVVTGLRPAHGLVASAQLGVPSAVATIGLASGALRPGQAAAIIGAAAASLAVAAIGAALSGLPHPAHPPPEPT